MRRATVLAIASLACSAGCLTRYESIIRAVPTLGPSDPAPPGCPATTSDTNDEGTRTLLWRADADGRCRLAAEKLTFDPVDESGVLALLFATGPIAAWMPAFGPLRATHDPDLFVCPPDRGSTVSRAGLVRIHERGLLDTATQDPLVHAFFEGARLVGAVIDATAAGFDVFGRWRDGVWAEDLASGESPFATGLVEELARRERSLLAGLARPPEGAFARASVLLEVLLLRSAARRLVGTRHPPPMQSALQVLAAACPGCDLPALLALQDPGLTTSAIRREVSMFAGQWGAASSRQRLGLVASLHAVREGMPPSVAALLRGVVRSQGGADVDALRAEVDALESRKLPATAAGLMLAVGKGFGDAGMLERGRATFLGLASSLLVPVELYAEAQRVLAGTPGVSARHADRWVGSLEAFTGVLPAAGVPGDGVTLRLARAQVERRAQTSDDGSVRRTSQLRLTSTGTIEGSGERHDRAFDLTVDGATDTPEGLERTLQATYAERVARFVSEIRSRHASKRIESRLAGARGLSPAELAVERAWLRRVFADDPDPALATLRGDAGIIAGN